ncbi:aminotransferase class IV [Carboxylicivirga linearis]|uniref:branched-chain-amino-acid transaminase n=1 Tax=Carboxylicivirga linearis TaxID=1628157 RepID=A0ABS5JSR0_9BACT|nr:aminotransferase class IV [Carboxylicivirga linearis]MBS2097897.1 aminotransferase class IV [Carboxylicivirga linearis]
MSVPQYICLNGQKTKADQPLLMADNRAFRYGDALFETIRCIHQIPLFFEDHYQRLLSGMSMLKMQTHSLPPIEIMREQISSLINKNRLFGDVRVRLTIFREDGGLYTPNGNKANYLIETSGLDTHYYTLNSKGLLLGNYTEDNKSINRFSRFKSANSLLFVLAGLFKKENRFDEVLISNEKNLIIETLASNLYWIKNGEVYTPRRTSGCVEGVMRKQIITLLINNGYKVVEVEGTSINELLAADEIFISNAIQGIQWVVGIENKRYFCKIVKDINRLLNDWAANYLMDFQEN